MYRSVLFTRRLGKHLHAGVEDFLAEQYQARLSAAKQGCEKLAEVAVGFIKRILQPAACFAVYAANGIFQRGDSLFQILRLAIQVSFALALAIQLLYRC